MMASPASQQESSDNSKLAEGSSDGQEEALDPMQMDEILDKVFGYCALTDLASCRRASKQWFNVSLTHWLDKAPMLKLRLNPKSFFKNDKGTMSAFLHSARNEFHQYAPYEFGGLRKYKKFEIKGSTGDPVHHQMLQLFLPNCGEWITELKVSLEFSDWDTYQTVMLSRMTPGLVKLEADVRFSDGFDQQEEKDGVYEVVSEAQKKLQSLQIDFDFKNYPDGGLPVVGWIQLLQRYPNLKTLVHFVDKPERLQDVDRMLEAIWTIRQADKKLLDLKDLEIGCETNDVVNSKYLGPLLRDTGLTLGTFCASVGVGADGENKRIYEVLESQATKLRKLTLYSDHLHRLEDFQPPAMKSVQTLVVHGWIFENFGFLRSFPALKSLTFGGGITYDAVLQESTEEVLEGVEMSSLEILHSDYKAACFLHRCDLTRSIVDWRQIRMLARLMPNLKDFQACLNNETVQEVFQSWPLLEHLSIFGNEVDDEGLTGRGDDDGEGITNLQGLRSLTIKHFNVDNLREDEDYLAPTKITERSLAAFVDLPHLEKVDVTMNRKLLKDNGVLIFTMAAMLVRIKSPSITWGANPSDEEEEDEESASFDAENGQKEENDDSEEEGGGGSKGTSDDSDGDSNSDRNNDDGGADADNDDNGVDDGSNN